MSGTVNFGSRVVVCVLSVAAVAATEAEAAFYPVFTNLRGRAFAYVDPNTPGAPVIVSDNPGPTGDFVVDVSDSDSGGGRTCDVIIDLDAHVDPDGLAGSATLQGTWIGTNINTPPVITPNGGAFEMGMYFTYSYYADVSTTLTIDINTVLTGSITLGTGTKPMEINHSLTVDGEYTEIALNGNTHVVYNFPADSYVEFEIDHYPNVGTSPWPNVNSTLTNTMTFSITADPHDGDTDGDGDVDFDDFLAVQNFFGDAGPDSPGDADNDGDCDFDDFLAVSNFFGYPAEGGGGEGEGEFVPEPASAALLGCGLTVLVLRRR